MLTQQQIEQLKQTIVEVEQPDQIILFGSYAYGEPHEASDLDILVVKDDTIPRHKRGKEVLKALSYIRFPLDIVFYTPEEINKWRHTSAEIILESGREPLPLDTVCFHCQQAVEKYLKGFLAYHKEFAFINGKAGVGFIVCRTVQRADCALLTFL